VQVYIDKIILSQAYQFYNKLPESISLNLKGVRIPISNKSMPIPVIISAFGYAPYYISLTELHELGYPDIRANISLDAKLQQNKLSLTVNINTDAWGKFTILIDLNKVSKYMKKMELISIQLKYFDAGLVNKLIAYLASRNKITPTQLQQNFITKLNRDVGNITSNVQRFIQNPDVLTIKLKPDFPMNIKMLKTFPIQKIKITVN
jgi:hypothetical protein